jgi:uncharacterized protein YjbI with pentapeptide repeats
MSDTPEQPSLLSNSDGLRVVLNRHTREIIFSAKVGSVKDLLELAVATHVTLAEAKLSQKQLAGGYFSGGILPGADLSHAELSEANFARADLRGADLTGANLIGANLEAADLLAANMTGCKLSQANLVRANLGNANLTAADLSGADLSYANMDGADLTSSRMDVANLEGVSMLRTIRNRTADRRTESLERLNRLLIQPSAAVLLQLLFFAIQISTADVMGPFMLFWFVGVVSVNVYLMLTRSWWWSLGLAAQLIFFMLQVLGERRLIMVF